MAPKYRPHLSSLVANLPSYSGGNCGRALPSYVFLNFQHLIQCKSQEYKCLLTGHKGDGGGQRGERERLINTRKRLLRKFLPCRLPKKSSRRTARAGNVAQWVESLSTGSKNWRQRTLQKTLLVRGCLSLSQCAHKPCQRRSALDCFLPYLISHLQSLDVRLWSVFLSHAHILHEVDKRKGREKVPEAFSPFLWKEELSRSGSPPTSQLPTL